MLWKCNDKLTDSFDTSAGFKQGCILSLILFSIFLNNLPEIFDAECDPVNLNYHPCSCLMTVAYLGGCIACACTPGGHKGAPKSDQKGRQKEEEEKKRKERKGEKEEKGRGKGKEKEKRKEKETKKRKGDIKWKEKERKIKKVTYGKRFKRKKL